MQNLFLGIHRKQAMESDEFLKYKTLGMYNKSHNFNGGTLNKCIFA